MLSVLLKNSNLTDSMTLLQEALDIRLIIHKHGSLKGYNTTLNKYVFQTLKLFVL